MDCASTAGSVVVAAAAAAARVRVCLYRNAPRDEGSSHFFAWWLED